MVELSRAEARRLLLRAQGLARRAPFGRGVPGVRRAIEHIGYVQVDTISVVERAHHHVLRSRVENYQPAMLDRLQRSAEVFEYWSHAAAYLPMRDYRYYTPMMDGFRATRPLDERLAREIKARIEAEGPLSSRDFEGPSGKASGWWDWKPAKRALETMFLSGELMVRHREGFQKVFDLTENVLPPATDTRRPDDVEWCKFIIRSGVRSAAVGSAADLTYPRRAMARFTRRSFAKPFSRAFNELVESGELTRVEVDGRSGYAATAVLAEGPVRIRRQRCRVLSPFDPLIINRPRLSAWFGMDYTLECYVPESRRAFGYFALPVLWGDRLVARLDAKAVRGAGRLEIRNLAIEAHTHLDERLRSALEAGIDDFARANGCERVHWIGKAQRVARSLGLGARESRPDLAPVARS